MRNKYLIDSLIILFCRAGGHIDEGEEVGALVAVPGLVKRHHVQVLHTGAVLRVPLVPARDPGELRLEGLDEIVDRPTDHRVVVHPHIHVNYTDCVSDP